MQGLVNFDKRSLHEFLGCWRARGCVPLRARADIQLAGEYGLRNKREIWRIQLTLSKVRPVNVRVAGPHAHDRSDVPLVSSSSSTTKTPSDCSRATP